MVEGQPHPTVHTSPGEKPSPGEHPPSREGLRAVQPSSRPHQDPVLSTLSFLSGHSAPRPGPAGGGICEGQELRGIGMAALVPRELMAILPHQSVTQYRGPRSQWGGGARDWKR